MMEWITMGAVLAVAAGGLIALGVRLVRRLERIERLLEERGDASGFGEIVARLEQVERRLDRPVSDPESPAGLRDLERVAAELRGALERLAGMLAERAGDSMRDGVEAELRRRGFDSVRFLDAPPRDDPDGGRRISVEADRDGMKHKGHVVVRSGAPAECRLRPIHGMFP
jgi:hypothetical protein